MLTQMVENWLCWVMVIVAWFAYQQLFVLYQQRHQLSQQSQDEQQLSELTLIPSVLISALPLMGLLGTIMGLQLSFTGMMSFGVNSQVVSGGIADALLTTQLGLVLAIPGWLVLVFVKGAMQKATPEEAAHG